MNWWNGTIAGRVFFAVGALLLGTQVPASGSVQPAHESAHLYRDEVALESPSSRASGFENLHHRLRLPPLPAVAASVEAPPVEAPPVDAPPVDAPALAPPPEQSNQPPVPPAAEPVGLPTSASAVGEHSSGTWAVVIGINDYPGTEYDLQSAINDSNDVTQALSGFGVAPDRQLVLQGQEANRAGIRRSLEWLKAHAGPDATAVFFYAGHVSKQRGGEAIVAADGGTLSDAELAASLDGLQAAKTWIGIAACYGGGFTEVMKPGRVLVAAASADEVAYENLNFKRSYLVEYMVRRAMIGNGIDTVQDAFTAAQQALRNEFPGRVPVQFDQMTQALDLSASPAGQPTTNRPSR